MLGMMHMVVLGEGGVEVKIISLLAYLFTK